MITVKLYAVLKDMVGRDELMLDLDNGTVGQILNLIAREYPSASEFISSGRILVAVNKEFAKQDQQVSSGDEIALMPPFSGGAGLT